MDEQHKTQQTASLLTNAPLSTLLHHPSKTWAEQMPKFGGKSGENPVKFIVKFEEYAILFELSDHALCLRSYHKKEMMRILEQQISREKQETGRQTEAAVEHELRCQVRGEETKRVKIAARGERENVSFAKHVTHVVTRAKRAEMAVSHNRHTCDCKHCTTRRCPTRKTGRRTFCQYFRAVECKNYNPWETLTGQCSEIYDPEKLPEPPRTTHCDKQQTGDIREAIKVLVRQRLHLAAERRAKYEKKFQSQLVLKRVVSVSKQHYDHVMGKLMPLFAGPFEVKRDVFLNCYELVVPGTSDIIGRQNLHHVSLRNYSAREINNYHRHVKIMLPRMERSYQLYTEAKQIAYHHETLERRHEQRNGMLHTERLEPSDSEVTIVQVQRKLQHMKGATDNLAAAKRSDSLVSLTSAVPVDNSGLAEPSNLSDSSEVVDSMDNIDITEGSLDQVVDRSADDLSIPEGSLDQVVDGSMDDLEIPEESLGKVIGGSAEDLEIPGGSLNKVVDGSKNDFEIPEGSLSQAVDRSTDDLETPEVSPGSMYSLGADRTTDEQGSYRDAFGGGIPKKTVNFPGTEHAEALFQQPQTTTNELEAVESESTSLETTVPGQQTSSQEQPLPLEEPGMIAKSVSSLGAPTDTQPAGTVPDTQNSEEDISEVISIDDITLSTSQKSKGAEGDRLLFEGGSASSLDRFANRRRGSESSIGIKENKTRNIFWRIGRLFTKLFRGKEENSLDREIPSGAAVAQRIELYQLIGWRVPSGAAVAQWIERLQGGRSDSVDGEIPSGAAVAQWMEGFQLQGEITEYLSVDTVMDTEQSTTYPVEFLNSLQFSGYVGMQWCGSQSAPSPQHLGVPGSTSGGVISGFPQVGIVPDDARWSAGSPLHSGAAPYSLHFTLVGSQDLDFKSRSNIFTRSRNIFNDNAIVVHERYQFRLRTGSMRVEHLSPGMKFDVRAANGITRRTRQTDVGCPPKEDPAIAGAADPPKPLYLMLLAQVAVQSLPKRSRWVGTGIFSPKDLRSCYTSIPDVCNRDFLWLLAERLIEKTCSHLTGPIRIKYLDTERPELVGKHLRHLKIFTRKTPVPIDGLEVWGPCRPRKRVDITKAGQKYPFCVGSGIVLISTVASVDCSCEFPHAWSVVRLRDESHDTDRTLFIHKLAVPSLSAPALRHLVLTSQILIHDDEREALTPNATEQTMQETSQRLHSPVKLRQHVIGHVPGELDDYAHPSNLHSLWWVMFLVHSPVKLFSQHVRSALLSDKAVLTEFRRVAGQQVVRLELDPLQNVLVGQVHRYPQRYVQLFKKWPPYREQPSWLDEEKYRERDTHPHSAAICEENSANVTGETWKVICRLEGESSD
ncbi:hypothetical protein PR048_003822 [Dryococelus australis]|uniref:Uncharacterized protein n=1 Tax=Dryococelus australis TaxID=614101 RepID=A0ABQ9IPM3_9NEOP|nr:hypothetical protein PR048_003822 [Dryococelus australis]